MRMADPRPKPEKRVEKTPQGVEVPVPKRGEFFSNLKKIAGKAKGTDPPPTK